MSHLNFHQKQKKSYLNFHAKMIKSWFLAQKNSKLRKSKFFNFRAKNQYYTILFKRENSNILEMFKILIFNVKNQNSNIRIFEFSRQKSTLNFIIFSAKIQIQIPHLNFREDLLIFSTKIQKKIQNETFLVIFKHCVEPWKSCWVLIENKFLVSKIFALLTWRHDRQ